MNSNINIEKLKQEKEKTQILVKLSSEEYKAKIEEIRNTRQATRQVIIKKINEKEAPKKTPIKINPAKIQSLKDQIQVIDDKRVNVEKKAIDIQERLSYTLQIDKSSISKQYAIRHKTQQKDFNINEKLVSLNPAFNKLYLYSTTLLAFLCILVIIFIAIVN